MMIRNWRLEAPSVHRKAIGFMTDKGSAFPLVAERFSWTHLLDHRHFATQILSAWHGLSDPKKSQSDVYKLLDLPCVETMNSLLKQALSKYPTKRYKHSSRKTASSNINFAILIPVKLLLLVSFLTREWKQEWLI
jgi:hypothetical protein